MATNPKKLPCPNCGSQSFGIGSYDHGWKHVECLKCEYMGPGEGSVRQAIKSHNERAAAAAAKQ